MPNPNPNETKDEFIKRCMSHDEAVTDYPDESQRFAVCNSIWEEDKTQALSNYRNSFVKEKISFDYDETLTTDKIMQLAKRWISKGADVYIISARSNKEPMLTRAKELCIPESRVYATGSNKAKIEKIKELQIVTHYDNNPDVIKELGSIGRLV